MPLAAFANAARGGSILDRIANPPQVNLLGDYRAAMDTAGSIYNLRSVQANEAAGQAYQAAINPQTGEFDPQEFRRQLASRPQAAMAAGSSLANTQNIANQQFELSKVALGWYNGALGALPDTASRDQVINTINSGVASGILTPAQAQREISMVPTDQAQMPGFMQQHRLTAAAAMDQFHAQYGTRQPVTTEEGTTFPVVPPANQGGTGPFVARGYDPKFLAEPSIYPPVAERDANGKPTGRYVPMTNGEYLEMVGVLPKGYTARVTSGQPAAGGGPNPPPSIGTSGRPPPALQNPNKPAPAPVPTGAVGGGASIGAPGGAPAAAAPAAPVAAPPAAPPVPAAPGSGHAPPGAPAASNPLMPPGVQVAAAGPGFAPAVGPAAPPGAAVGGDVNAIMAGIQRARAAAGGAPAITPVAAPGAGGGTTFNVPTGRAALSLTPAEEFNVKNSPPQFQKEVDTGVNAIQQSALLGNMLADAAGFVPGKDATAVQAFKSRLQYWAPGISRAFGGDPSDIANKEGFDKLAAQLQTQQMQASGSPSDMRMQVVEAGTPHSDLTPAGIDKILRQLQGNSDYLQYRAKLAAAYPNQNDYRGFQQDVAKLDPRVFQLTRMTDAQRQEYMKSLDSSTYKEVSDAIRWKVAKDKELAGE